MPTFGKLMQEPTNAHAINMRSRNLALVILTVAKFDQKMTSDIDAR